MENGQIECGVLRHQPLSYRTCQKGVKCKRTPLHKQLLLNSHLTKSITKHDVTLLLEFQIDSDFVLQYFPKNQLHLGK